MSINRFFFYNYLLVVPAGQRVQHYEFILAYIFTLKNPVKVLNARYYYVERLLKYYLINFNNEMMNNN